MIDAHSRPGPLLRSSLSWPHGCPLYTAQAFKLTPRFDFSKVKPDAASFGAKAACENSQKKGGVGVVVGWARGGGGECGRGVSGLSESTPLVIVRSAVSQEEIEL